ncbi:nucleotidyltransferase domain-containing protein [Ditylenchus destructor]|uniref:Nucleotidyltransferase domain-containing protein n=1 Tax=Ditylenchus destructor TaxID=166010 RepID=A0AAD4N2J0_9BILA|nr:nucleotidyltransferase domain-containing protein [Ditylenchus destructor]
MSPNVQSTEYANQEEPEEFVTNVPNDDSQAKQTLNEGTSTCSAKTHEESVASSSRTSSNVEWSPTPTTVVNGLPNAPWARRRYEPNLNGIHDEILDFHAWLKPTAEEIAIRRKIFNQVADALSTLFYRSQIYLFGSVATNLFLPSSDIDIAIDLGDKDLGCLDKVAKLLRDANKFENINIISRTSVPIVKLIDSSTLISVDISFNTQHNLSRCASWINRQKDFLPELEPIVLILKQFLVQYGYNEPWNGGLPSYALVLMVVHIITQYPPPNRRCSLGHIFINFLLFFGIRFDYNEMGLRIWSGPDKKRCGVISKCELAFIMGIDKCSSILFIQDPVQPNNNVGKSVHNLMSIKESFAKAYLTINNAIMCCKTCDKSYIDAYYYGPMISLVVQFSDEEAKKRYRCINSIRYHYA